MTEQAPVRVDPETGEWSPGGVPVILVPRHFFGVEGSGTACSKWGSWLPSTHPGRCIPSANRVPHTYFTLRGPGSLR
jgi:hypothetical protein